MPAYNGDVVRKSTGENNGMLGILCYCMVFFLAVLLGVAVPSTLQCAQLELETFPVDLPLDEGETYASPQASAVQDLPQANDVLASPQARAVQDLPQACDVQDSPQARGVQASPQARGVQASPQANDVSASSQARGGERSGSRKIMLFGTVELRTPIKNLPKWERVRQAESKQPTFSNADATLTKEVATRWAKLRDNLQGKPVLEQAKSVNAFFNQWPYKLDMTVWGVEDYWATPKEFLKKSGDCEDYAITKYYALRDLGVPAEKMRVVALKDTIRNLGHAVVVLYEGNNAYILDNMTNLLFPHSKLSHYAPQFSVNEMFLWRHVKPKGQVK